MNSATPEAVFDSPEAFDDPENPWVGLAFSREAVDHEGNPVKIFLDIKPLDQIQGIVDTIIKTPYTRRAVAITSFPPTDTLLDDPPCLRYLWFRGFNEGPNGELEIEMHSHWRSRDAYQAAFMNMFAMTDLMSKVIKNVQIGLNKNVENLIEKPCPVCLSLSLTNDVPLERQDASMIRCRNCGSNPYLVLPGSYIDTSDSFHIYGKDISEFENRVLTAIENRAPTDRWWDLEGKGLSHLLEEGVAKDAEMIKHRDDRNDISLNTKPSNSATYHTPLELHFGRRKVG